MPVRVRPRAPRNSKIRCHRRQLWATPSYCLCTPSTENSASAQMFLAQSLCDVEYHDVQVDSSQSSCSTVWALTMNDNDDWLSLTTEETLDPSLPICDPHHHLWAGRTGVTPQDYLLDDFLADIDSGHNVVSTIFIECGTMFSPDGPIAFRPIGETQFANEVAAMSSSGRYGKTRVAAGIVGTAYLSDGDSVGAVLDAQLATGGERFKGIRQAAVYDDDPSVPNHRTNPPRELYANRKFREGFAHLARRDLSFEAWCYHPQLPELTELAQTFPDTTIILDHFGGPLGVCRYAGRVDEVFDSWREAILPLSKCPNVFAKLGGIAMEVNGHSWHTRHRPPGSQELLDATGRYYDYTIEIFGTNRCMFESNFPVDRISTSYNVLWNAFKKLTASYSLQERAQLFHDNAAKTYRLL